MTAEEEFPAERWVEYAVQPADAGRMVRELLTRRMGLSNQMVRRLAQTEGVRLQGAKPFLSSRVAAGQRLEVRFSSTEPGTLRPVPMELAVVYEDADLLAVNKPPGLLVHPARRSHIATLVHGATYHFQQQGVQARAHPVHRLDRDTSGLVLIAKHAPAHRDFARQLLSRELQRGYLALVHGSVSAASGTIDVPIARHPNDAHLRVAASIGSAARTHFRVVERFPHTTLLEVELETGRTHQIRVHLAHLGHPLLGDTAYGGPARPPLTRQALHAHRLHCLHPLTRQPLALYAPLPDDLGTALQVERHPGGTA